MVAIACAAALLSCGAAERKRVTDPQVASLTSRFEGEANFSGDEIINLNKAGVAPGLIAAMSHATPHQRERIEPAVVTVLIDLGRPVLAADENYPERLAPIVNNTSVVEYLSRTLSRSNEDVRDEIGAVLANQVPGSALQVNAKAILEALQQHPGTSGGVLILGR